MHDPFAPHDRVRRRTLRPDATTIDVVALVHRYPPIHNAGGEMMVHALLRDLVARGHTATVFVARHEVDEGTVIDDVPVYRYRGARQLAGADIVLTHLDMTRDAVRAAVDHGQALVHVIHNDRQLTYHGVAPRDADLVVFNSRWIAAVYPTWPSPAVIIPPPVEPGRYRTTPGERVTLMNLSPAKGGFLFWDLVRRMPEVPFLAVKGAYAQQVIPPGPLPHNVILLENTPNVVADVYAQTKVLLMPSSYESFGRCAMEAAASGIPTVAAPTLGLVESLGPAGIWCDLTDTAAWERSIGRLLDEPDYYGVRQSFARARSSQFDPATRGDFELFEQAMLAVVRGTPVPDYRTEGQ